MKECNKKDALWLTALMLDADVYGGSSEDGTVKSKMLAYVKNMIARPDIIIIAPVPGKMIHTFVRQNSILYDIHTAIKKDSGLTGKEKVRLTREACTMMVRNKGARKFTTHVPTDNRAAGIYAIACGLERVGVISSAIKKNGVLLDMVLYQSKDEDIQNVLRGL